jgi:hypothetical protein
MRASNGEKGIEDAQVSGLDTGWMTVPFIKMEIREEKLTWKSQ